DRGEGNRRELMLLGQAQGVPVGVGQQLWLTAVAPAPDRPDGVNDVAGGQVAARGDHRVARLAAADTPALLQDGRPARAVDLAVYCAFGAPDSLHARDIGHRAFLL